MSVGSSRRLPTNQNNYRISYFANAFTMLPALSKMRKVSAGLDFERVIRLINIVVFKLSATFDVGCLVEEFLEVLNGKPLSLLSFPLFSRLKDLALSRVFSWWRLARGFSVYRSLVCEMSERIGS